MAMELGGGGTGVTRLESVMCIASEHIFLNKKSRLHASFRGAHEMGGKFGSRDGTAG